MTENSRFFEFAMLLDGKGSARSLNENEVAAWKESDGILWIDLDQNKASASKWVNGKSNVDNIVADILLAGETRPRSIVEPNGLIAVMRGINMNAGAVPDDMVAVRIWLEKNRIITSHRRTMLSLSDVKEALMSGQGPVSSGDFLVELTGYLSGRIGSSVENIEMMVENLDAQMATATISDLRTSLGIVRRQAAAIRRHLSPQRDALDRLARAQSVILSQSEAYDLREAGDHITRQLEDLDLARENALVTQEELMNRIAQEQNSRMYLLSIVSAIFLPLMFVTGLLGMNVAGLPGTVNPKGFVYAAAIMIVFGIGMAVYFRWKKWI